MYVFIRGISIKYPITLKSILWNLMLQLLDLNVTLEVMEVINTKLSFWKHGKFTNGI